MDRKSRKEFRQFKRSYYKGIKRKIKEIEEEYKKSKYGVIVCTQIKVRNQGEEEQILYGKQENRIN